MPETTPRLVAAQVTLRFDDGKTWQFQLDTEDEDGDIAYALDVETDIVEDEPYGNWARFKAGTRQRVMIQLAGRGPRPVQSESAG